MEPQPLQRPATLPSPRRTFTDAEWERIRRGEVAAHMQDKWVAAVAGDTLTLADASSGAGVYSARFRRGLSGWTIVAAQVENDPASYRRGSDDQESRALQVLVETLLLHD